MTRQAMNLYGNRMASSCTHFAQWKHNNSFCVFLLFLFLELNVAVNKVQKLECCTKTHKVNVCHLSRCN